MPTELSGLWSVKFVSNAQNVGAGIIVIDADNNVLGGDAQYYYVGKLAIANDIVNAQIAIKIHNRFPGALSVFGPLEAFDLILSGRSAPNEMVLSGRMKQSSQHTISIQCNKLLTV